MALGLPCATSPRPNGQLLSVALIDLDKFKDVNDRLGHAAGDQLLVQTAQRLRDCLRPTDTVARLGGDEFVALLLDVHDTNGVERVVRKIMANLSRPALLDGARVEVTISLGLSVFARDGEGTDQLLRVADEAMYRAKRGGRNGYALGAPPIISELSPKQ